MMMELLLRKTFKYLFIFSAFILMESCTSYPLKVCVSTDNSNFTVFLCEDVYIEGVHLYHLDTLSNKYITDWDLNLSKDSSNFVKEITIGITPSGYISKKELGDLYDGKYIFSINTSRHSGILILEVKAGKVINYKHDSTTECENELCFPKET